MKTRIKILLALLISSGVCQGQGIHFSQFYNAPLLLNPANTALTNADDYRAGLNYRNQYSNIPVPFNTMGAFADFTIRRNESNNSWLGLGVQVWNDKAGVGALSLTKIQGNLAYHILTSDRTSWSLGMGVAQISRSINFDKLSFDSQWDEFSYNNDLPSMEQISKGSTRYLDVQTGASFTYNNQQDFFIKFSASAMHLNKPKETFLGNNNTMGIRPLVSIEAEYKTSDNYILKPAAYYTTQKQASELVFGASGNINLVRNGRNFNTDKNELLHGIYYRLGDALIFTTGYKFNNTTLTLSYDQTVSKLKQANRGFGAFEISLLTTGLYKGNSRPGRTLGCPRF